MLASQILQKNIMSVVKIPVLGKSADYCITKWLESYTFIFFHAEKPNWKSNIDICKAYKYQT